MKKINVLLVALMLFVGSAFAQTQKAAWPEMKAFHSLMSGTFHPAEENNLQPLKEKAKELYNAAKTWYASEIPSNYKPEETNEALKQLMVQCNDIWAEVAAKGTDAKLKDMITKAHDIFHRIAGECKKADH